MSLGGGGPTQTQAPTPTRTPVATQAETSTQPEVATQPETSTAPGVATRTEVVTTTGLATQTQTQVTTQVQTTAVSPAASAPPTVATGAAASSSTGSSTPAWVWWLIAAVVLALITTTVVLLRRRNRKQAWATKFGATEREVVWYARELLPQLAQAPTPPQIAGGWRIESARVVAIEDRLTSLEAGAVDDRTRRQARRLRDAVRSSRSRLAGLDAAPDMMSAQSLLRAAAADVEGALAAMHPSRQTSQVDATQR